MADEITKIKARVKRHLSATDAQIEAFTLRLEKFLDLNLEEIVGKIQTGDTSGADAARILGSMFTELERAGLEREVGKLKAIFAEELRFIRDEFIERDIDEPISADTDREAVDLLINNSLDKVSTKIQQYGLNVQSTVMQAVVTGQKPDYKAIKEKFGNVAASQVRTEVETSIATFNRTITVNKALDLGFKLFIYIGPEDNVTRDFCQRLLDKDPPIYTIDQINDMDNGQGLPAFSAGGGYNCRHQWRPISEKTAKARGWAPSGN